MSIPWGVAVNPTTNRIYVANNKDNIVSVIDGGTDAVLKTVPVGMLPMGVAVDPVANRVYIANSGSNTVSVLDGATNTVLAAIPVGNTPRGITVDQTTNRAYVADFASNAVSVLDLATNTVLATVPIGAGPADVAVNPVTHRVYIANYSDDTVSVVYDGPPPTVTITGVSDQAVYTLGAVPTPGCAAEDQSGAGLAGPCTGTLSGGTPNGVGTFTYTATASDNLGGTTTASITYRVIYRWTGFLPPLGDPGSESIQSTRTAQAGSAVPVKFRLERADGSVVAANTAPLWLVPQQGGGVPSPSGETYRSGDNGQQYLYTWKTDKAQAGADWQIGVQFDDGQVYTATVGVR